MTSVQDFESTGSLLRSLFDSSFLLLQTSNPELYPDTLLPSLHPLTPLTLTLTHLTHPLDTHDHARTDPGGALTKALSVCVSCRASLRPLQLTERNLWSSVVALLGLGGDNGDRVTGVVDRVNRVLDGVRGAVEEIEGRAVRAQFRAVRCVEGAALRIWEGGGWGGVPRVEAGEWVAGVERLAEKALAGTVREALTLMLVGPGGGFVTIRAFGRLVKAMGVEEGKDPASTARAFLRGVTSQFCKHSSLRPWCVLPLSMGLASELVRYMAGPAEGISLHRPETSATPHKSKSVGGDGGGGTGGGGGGGGGAGRATSSSVSSSSSHGQQQQQRQLLPKGGGGKGGKGGGRRAADPPSPSGETVPLNRQGRPKSLEALSWKAMGPEGSRAVGAAGDAGDGGDDDYTDADPDAFAFDDPDNKERRRAVVLTGTPGVVHVHDSPAHGACLMLTAFRDGQPEHVEIVRVAEGFTVRREAGLFSRLGAVVCESLEDLLREVVPDIRFPDMPPGEAIEIAMRLIKTEREGVIMPQETGEALARRQLSASGLAALGGSGSGLRQLFGSSAAMPKSAAGKPAGMAALEAGGCKVGVVFADLGEESSHFLDHLVTVYRDLQRQKKPFEVVMVGVDMSASQLQDLSSRLPWLTHPCIWNSQDDPSKWAEPLRALVQRFLVSEVPWFGVLDQEGQPAAMKALSSCYIQGANAYDSWIWVPKPQAQEPVKPPQLSRPVTASTRPSSASTNMSANSLTRSPAGNRGRSVSEGDRAPVKSSNNTLLPPVPRIVQKAGAKGKGKGSYENDDDDEDGDETEEVGSYNDDDDDRSGDEESEVIVDEDDSSEDEEGTSAYQYQYDDD
jgi:hypothetical protein